MPGAASLRLFRHADFRWLWIGQLVSVFGDRFTYLALLAVVLDRSRTPSNPAWELSWIPIVSFAPAILFGPWFGALVDGWDRKRVLVLSDSARAVIALLFVPAVPWRGLEAAFALVFLLYVANAFFLPARSAIVPELVPEENLVEANSVLTLAAVVATIAGSLIAGWAIGRFGWRIGFALDAATYLVSVLALMCIRSRAAPPKPTRHASGRAAYAALLTDVREGARITLRNRRALAAIGAIGLLWIAGGTLHVAAPILLAGRRGGIVHGIGAIIAATAAGMVVGSLALATRGGRGDPWVRTAWGLAGIGAALAAFARSGSGPIDLALGFTAGIFAALLLVTTEAVMQAAIPREAQGRVFALRDFVARLLVLLSAAGAGLLVSRKLVMPAEIVLTAGMVLAIGGSALALGARGRHRG